MPWRSVEAPSGQSDWGGRGRTCNLPVNSRALCQLSYTPLVLRQQKTRRFLDGSGAYQRDHRNRLRPTRLPEEAVQVSIRIEVRPGAHKVEKGTDGLESGQVP